jgi:GAF domain-containing protein
MSAMQPTPESAEVLAEFTRLGDSRLADLLAEYGDRVRAEVPQCWGISVAILDEFEVTFTLIANDRDIAALDGAQYLAGGPCEQAARTGKAARVDDLRGPLDEEGWREFATLGAASGVLSTLSLPLHAAGRLVGGVNLYASAPRAFVGHEPQVARIFGALPQDAVFNADMPFASLTRSRTTPSRLADQSRIDQAVGITMGRLAVSETEARARLATAAERAGIDQALLAETIVRGLVKE